MGGEGIIFLGGMLGGLGALLEEIISPPWGLINAMLVGIALVLGHHIQLEVRNI